MPDETQNFFRKIISTNEEILKLRILLYGLKIRALNAQILSANSGSFAASYGVVATEIIHFNEKIQDTNERLSDNITTVLRMASKIQKLSRIHLLIERSIDKSKERKIDPFHFSHIRKSFEGKAHEMEELELELKQKFAEIRILVRNSIKLCLEGRTVSLQTRIESATIVENQKLFLAVAESFDSALNIIESSYRYLVKIW